MTSLCRSARRSRRKSSHSDWLMWCNWLRRPNRTGALTDGSLTVLTVRRKSFPEAGCCQLWGFWSSFLKIVQTFRLNHILPARLLNGNISGVANWVFTSMKILSAVVWIDVSTTLFIIQGFCYIVTAGGLLVHHILWNRMLIEYILYIYQVNIEQLLIFSNCLLCLPIAYLQVNLYKRQIPSFYPNFPLPIILRTPHLSDYLIEDLLCQTYILDVLLLKFECLLFLKTKSALKILNQPFLAISSCFLVCGKLAISKTSC